MFSGEDGFFSNLFGSKPEKGVTKQRGKSKDRYHEDPPDIPGGYDSEEEIRISHTHHRHHTHEEKSTFQGLLKPSSDEQPQKKDKSDGLISNILGTKEKGVTKQRGKSKDRYHDDPPHIPGGYDSEEEIKIRHTRHHPPKEKSGDAKTKLQGLFKSSSDKEPHRDNAYLAKHESRPNKSRAKGGGRETPKKSTFGTLFGSDNDAKSTKKKSQDRYHQKNPYEKYEKESKGGGRGGSGGKKAGGGGGWWSSGGGGGSSGEAKSGKSKGRSAGRQSKGGSSGFSLPSF